jgi:excisionase family DNA binding protein
VAALRAALELIEAEAAAPEPSPPVEARNPMLTVSEASRELACSAAHVRALCASGALRAMRTPGGRYRIRMRDLRAYERRSTAPRASGCGGNT